MSRSEVQQLSFGLWCNRHDNARCGFGEQRRDIGHGVGANWVDRWNVDLRAETRADTALGESDRQASL